jgi:hypothetical protein
MAFRPRAQIKPVLLFFPVTIGGVPVSTGHSAIEEHAEHGRSLVKTTVNN